VATRADVARLAGVSTSTVSYALSGARPISPATRRRIEAAMRELGYTPNAIASGLARRRSRILALLLPSGPGGPEGADLQYVVAAAGLARERGYHLVLWTVSEGEVADVGRYGRSGLVDGVLLMEVRLDDDRIRLLQSAGLPVAMIGRTARPGELPYADADFDQITRLALDHLARLGHVDVGLLTASRHPPDVPNGPSVRIRESAERAAAGYGIELVTQACRNTVAEGRVGLSRLRDRCARLTAVVAGGWEAGVGVLQAAEASGRAVPRSLSVLAITSHDGTDITTPSLTTVSQPAADIARAATAALIDQLEDPASAPARLLLPGRLRPGGSTGPVRRPDLGEEVRAPSES